MGALLAALILALGTRPVAAQLFARPWLHWRTLRAGRFDVHYPPQLAAWAQFVTERLPAIDSAVTRVVGYSPPQRVQIVIEDPFDISNGFAFTLLDKPVIVFWASPPDPRESIGQFTSWGEMLAVHEYGHVVHLTRPSRNPFTRTLWRLAPVDLGPIALRAPRWVIEGYATYIEGRVTGSGRPHGVWRPATLRQWAIEGRLPNYAQLSSWSDFEGGSFAYLAGSAFLEWLARHNGDSSLVDIWRRLTARVNRSFDEAFTGVYGDPPVVLYDRFRAEVTADAVGIDSALAHAGLVEGEMVQHLTRGTGDPGLSRDGRFAAVVLRAVGRPARVVVWSTTPEADSLERRARERLLERDPQDVPARRVYPLPKRALATLVARDGRAYEDPRWMPDGKRILLWRATRRADGSLQPELYLWDIDRHWVRRLTSGAGVRNADPSPDGRRAVALRCAGGYCDVVVVDLTTGAVRVIAAGDVLTSFARPRWSPDGRSIAVALQRANRWRIALLDLDGSAPRLADPDDGANRFDPSWLSASSLVVVSDRTGTPNLERIDLGTANSPPVARSLTRITGATIAPELNRVDGSIWFLSLHSRGYDVRRLGTPSPVADLPASPLLDSRLVPAVVEPSFVIHSFAPASTSPGVGYGVRSRTTRWLPAAAAATTGREATLALVNSDVVGRLTLLGQGAFGSGDAWRGGSIEAAWRGTRPELHVSGFIARSDTRLLAFQSPLVQTDDIRGGHVAVDYFHGFDIWSARVSAGVSPEWLTIQSPTTARTGVQRNLAFAELRASSRQSGDAFEVAESISAHGTVGRTAGESYERGIVSATIRAAGRQTFPLDLGATYGHVSSAAPQFEQFSIGGLPSTLTDRSLLIQRFTMSALPAVVATGDRILTYRAATAVAGLTPFFWGASTRMGTGRFDVWHRVLGIELEVNQSPLPVIGTPGARLVGGVARSLDEPFARETRAYGLISLSP